MTGRLGLFTGVLKLSRSGCCRILGHGPRSGSRRILSSVKNPAKAAFRDSARPNVSPRGKIIAATLASGAVAASILVGLQRSPVSTGEQGEQGERNDSAEAAVLDGPVRHFRLAEVKLHDGTSERPWVTKGDSIYDITDWVEAHPGGEVILRAAGGSIDPYWDIFTIHKRQDVYEILEQYFIGKVHPQDLIDGKMPMEAIEDPFVNDPARDTRLRVLTARPCNAETPGEGLSQFLTPNEMFYVRNHMWVPAVEGSEHQLTIELNDGEEVSYTVRELKERFKHHKITATLQCAGNRRKNMTDHAKQTNGLQWAVGAISSAEWEGVKLRDVLADAGLNVTDPPEDAHHAQFMGLEAYGASIPIEKAIDARGDVLLAFRMNGRDLPSDHGFPLRVIVPGTVAARSVKWLRRIVIAADESPSQWQQRDYKCFGPNEGASADWARARAIQEMPVTSAITRIRRAASSSSDAPLRIEGYAYSGGGREITRVDISVDNGRTWDQAELLDDASAGARAWCWKRWRYTGVVRDAQLPTTFLVKATDEAYNTQPETHGSIYNVRGNLATAWHRVEYPAAADEANET
ncbi:MAG: hypothetical protein M1818_006309 [Claussenomyces sp. TS43310]|nr:MAG: hypothetical protein M1818_006309 [Claussenomyces sp. TS43310]